MGPLQTGNFLWKIRLVLINALVFACVYGLFELTYSTYAYFFRDASPHSYLVVEHPGQTVHFDPDRGFFLTETPSRMARITNGRVEYMGPFRGNAQGFADRDDFTIRRRTPGELRIGVFGDSFTTATFEPSGFPNWPTRAEDVGRSGGEPLTLLNFGLDGGGLANWASVMRNIVVKDKYDLDGLIFAVAWDDLYRKFAMFEQTDAKTLAYAQAASWDVNSQPRTEAEADALLRKHPLRNHYVLSPAQFDAAVSGRWRPRQWRFRITDRLVGIVGMLVGHRDAPWQAPSGFEPGQLALMREIRRLAEQSNLPIIVVYIPFREELIVPGYPTSAERSQQFAQVLGAKFIDGREAFRGLSAQQIRPLWFPYDGHWNHLGSSRFAEYMISQISTWVDPLRSADGSLKANHKPGASSQPPTFATDQSATLHHVHRSSIAR
jgi:hypothetical protein